MMIFSFAPWAAAESMLEAVPRTNWTSLEPTPTPGSVHYARPPKKPSSLASQTGVPEADTPEYAMRIGSAHTGAPQRITTAITKSLIATIRPISYT
jgi:hypothetical protein